MDEQDSGISDTNKFCAMIGHVCLQWALLELNLLGLLAAIENVPLERAEIMFGGLDMLPRCGMALNLARHHRLPLPMTKRIEAIRKSLQSGIAERRNQAVHGAHGPSDRPQHVRLRMVRWRGEKAVQHVSIADMYKLAMDIAALATEAGSVFDDYGVWKFGDHRPKDRDSKVAQANAGSRLKLAQRVYASINSFLRGL